MVTTTRALLLSTQLRLQHSPKRDTSLLLVFVEDADSLRLRHAVVDERDRRERGGREDNPPGVKRTRRVFPRPTYKA